MQKFIGTKIVSAFPDTKDGKPGYCVTYADGYVSWSPEDAFIEAYRPTNGVPFGRAVEAMKKGFRVARTGWNGKGMWLGLHKEGGTFIREECGTEIQYLDYIVMKTADNKLVPWLASQTDMLSDDWEILE